MEYRRLGRSGLKLSALSFGSWVTFSNQLDQNAAEECMKLAYDSGVNFFDNAEVYAQGQSEILMGKAIKKMGWSRDSFCISSKVFWGGNKPTQLGLSAKHVRDACEAALKRLQVDYLDLYFCHRPDAETPIEETVRAMDNLVRQGKVVYWGTSEWSAAQIEEAFRTADRLHLAPPTMEQPQYHLFHRYRMEAEYPPLFSKYGLGTTTWSPLASGILSGKYNEGVPPQSRSTLPGYEWLRDEIVGSEGKARIAKTKNLSTIAKELGATTAQLAIAWCMKNPTVSTVILGASNAKQLQENLAALDVAHKLSPAIMKQIDRICA